MSVRVMLAWSGGIAGCLLVIAAIGLGFWLLDKSETADNHRRDQAFVRANTVCGSPPRKIQFHGSGWSNGPWIEVTCDDGSRRAVTW